MGALQGRVSLTHFDHKGFHMSYDVVAENVILDGPHGPLTLRTYTSPTAPPSQVGFVWVHGGGFIGGDLDMPEADWVSRTIAATGIPVVSVDYKLAPPVPELGWDVPPSDGVHFPIASEEVTHAFLWAAESRFAGATDWTLGGASAGANLASGAALRLRDLAGTTPHSVILIYPLAHRVIPPFSDELAAKVASLPDEARFDPNVVKLLNDNYVGHDGDAGSPYAFVGGEDLRGFPPTLIVNTEHDALRASGEALASELAIAGVDVSVVRELDARHGHINDPSLPSAHRTVDRMIAWLGPSPLVGTTHEAPPA